MTYFVEETTIDDVAAPPDPAVDGAEFILDQPAEVPAIWGEGGRVLWAPGEALMIAGPQGVGKTTLAGLIVGALLGVIASVLGLPVAEFRGRILYLAMDRPRQISRSLRRQFSERDRTLLAERLTVRPGPPLADLAVNPTLLAAMARHYGASVVIVDSLKDAVVGLSDDAVAASYNRARQHLLSSGCELIELHHVVKRTSKNDQPGSAVDSIYGSTWLTSGCGSVVLISGEPGDPIVGFRHVKQPAEEVGPYRLLHDQDAGMLSIEHGVDLLELVRAAGPDGVTARDVAAAVTEKAQPSRSDIEKARRKLDKLVEAHVLVRLHGSAGGAKGGSTTAWFLADQTVHGRSRIDEKPQVNGVHGLFDTPSDHEPFTPFTQDPIDAGQGVHATDHADHVPGVHVSPGPRRGPVNGAPAADPEDR
ncbi:AAA family ATPase [Mycobacterium shigaense]|uniref:AAA family ATPase n=1 Tax=Mycobacterium shigaense TaxID=722731 RepID=UPI002AE0AA25|nr:AAA family ATPase [Mycobacterium shigaense]MEA1123888.1 AAA family ATPase [Mycobacterium shigaense]